MTLSQLLNLNWVQRSNPAIDLTIAKHAGDYRTLAREILQLVPVQYANMLSVMASQIDDPAELLPFCGGLLDVPNVPSVHSQVKAAVERLRKKLGANEAVWKLLMLPSTAPRAGVDQALQALMMQSVPFTGVEFRIAAGHPALRDALGGLVFDVRTEGKASRTAICPFEIEDAQTILIAHPLTLTAADQAKWKPRLTAHPPFDQFGQTAAGSPPPAFDVTQLTLDPSTLMTQFESRGWLRGRPDEAGVIRYHAKPFPPFHLQAIVHYTGIPTAYGGKWTPQQLRALEYQDLDTGATLDTGHPVAAAQVQTDLEALKQCLKRN
jgi:hypothetical protein